MITLYSGTPGSGKSYHAAYKIYNGLRFGRNFICNFDINMDNCSISRTGYYLRNFDYFKDKEFHHKKLGKFLRTTNDKLTVEFLQDYARKNHNFKEEGETCVIIDEASLIFNPRSWDNKDRLKWIEFLAQHRKWGYNFILIAQSDRMIDRQVRSLLEYDVKHRKINNYKFFGAVLGLLSGGCIFGLVTYWYGVKEKVSFETLRYSKRVASIYDTFFLFDDDAVEEEPEQESTSQEDGGKGKGVSPGVPLTTSCLDGAFPPPV